MRNLNLGIYIILNLSFYLLHVIYLLMAITCVYINSIMLCVHAYRSIKKTFVFCIFSFSVYSQVNIIYYVSEMFVWEVQYLHILGLPWTLHPRKL